MTLLSSTASTAPSATCATCASAPSLHRLLFLRCSRTSMPALYPRPEKKLRWPGWPGHWAEPNRIWWSLGAQTEKELWLQTFGVQPHISNLKTKKKALKTQKVEISKFEVTVTWMDEIFDSKRIQAMRIHITSYHYEPFKGPDGLLSPRMVSSSAFHLRPDCQCLTEKTTPPSTAFAGGVFCHTVIKSGDSTRSWRYFWTSRKASASSSCSPDSQG